MPRQVSVRSAFAIVIACVASIALTPEYAAAQTAPCGLDVIRPEGTAREERFVPSPPEDVRRAALKAIPALAAKISKDRGLHIEAKTDRELWQVVNEQARETGNAGFMGVGAFGTFHIDIAPALENGVSGSRLTVQFKKNKMKGRFGASEFATPFINEAVCLSTLFATVPVEDGSGPIATAETGQAVVLPAGTPVRVFVRDFLFSKTVKKDQAIAFQVADDVIVEGSVLIGRGAAATGRFTGVTGARGYGRHATLQFTIDRVVAIDGTAVALSASTQQARGARTDDVVRTALVSPVFGWAVKGLHAAVRAGTTYEVETAGDQTVRAAR
jgi:hypothetical protein